MFKKWTSADLKGLSQCKSSDLRHLRTKIQDSFPSVNDNFLDELLPKKSIVYTGKSFHSVLYLVNKVEILFVLTREGVLIPSLRLVHKYPALVPKIRVDRGAIKFILKGADVMCPGINSEGGGIIDKVDSGKTIAIYCEGKEHAIGVGILKMSTEDIVKVNKDIAIQNILHLNDGVWTHKGD